MNYFRDHASIKWEKHSLDVDRVWEVIGIDTVHYQNQCFLSVVDHGPGRFAVCREISSEGEGSILNALRSVISEHGAPKSLVMDNAFVFHGKSFEQLALRFKMEIQYRAAHSPGTNGIVERNHRQIKSSAAKSNSSIHETLY